MNKNKKIFEIFQIAPITRVIFCACNTISMIRTRNLQLRAILPYHPTTPSDVYKDEIFAF